MSKMFCSSIKRALSGLWLEARRNLGSRIKFTINVLWHNKED